MAPAKKKVSVIMPIFNRAGFLKDAFQAIKNQEIDDLELIVVDDGSTDDSRQLIDSLCPAFDLRYVFQSNQGAYVARNQGLDLATGEYIAFYDSDDLWHKHHLSECLKALEKRRDVDWVFGSLRRVTLTGEVLEPDSFRRDGVLRAFFSLACEPCGEFRILSDSRALWVAITDQINAELQTSVIRKSFFDDYRFDSKYRNAQDRFAFLRALASKKVAYFDRCHLTYLVHDDNDSLARTRNDPERFARISHALCQQYLDFMNAHDLSPNERKAIHAVVANRYFWSLGYNIHLPQRSMGEMFRCYFRAIQLRPTHFAYWRAAVTSTAKLIANSLGPS